MQNLKILITNLKLTSRSGTELYVRDLGLELLRRGHRPVVYAPVAAGGVAQELEKATIPVVQRLDQVGLVPDLIHGHHTHQLMAALLHFERAPAIFFCHDYSAWHDEPPVFPRILRYVPVDYTCLDRLVLQSGIPEARVQVILNFVDLERLRARPALPARPRRALVLGALASEPRCFAAIADACRAREIAAEAAQDTDHDAFFERPEEVLSAYDLVFAKGTAALEALAVGCAVILCDRTGVGPLVGTERLEDLRAGCFGRRVLQRPLTRETVGEQIDRYDANEAAEVSRRLRARSGLVQGVDELVDLYGDVIREHRSSGEPDREGERRAVARYMERIASTPVLIDSEQCRRQNAELRAARRRMQEDLERLRASIPPARRSLTGVAAG
jgi:hypothetical protein